MEPADGRAGSVSLRGATIDSAGAPIVVGIVEGTAAFEDETLVAADGFDVFVAKCEP